MRLRRVVLISWLALTLVPLPARADARSFEAGSLIVPMDLAYQDRGLLQAYGLVFQLLRQGVRVSWVIDPAKTWHAAPCDTPGDECAWDCAEEGTGEKCSYPTASPDFYAGATVLWDGDRGVPEGTAIVRHGYRGGPFVIDAADAERAREIVAAWNDPSRWDANPWARRAVSHVVTVHVASASFVGDVRRTLLAAPTIAVFSDGNEDIATGYLRAAGIPQSNGAEFPTGRCGAGACGPGTANPDMLTVESIMGEMGTCDAPNRDHRNGALFTDDGVPAYCQIMSMHWAVNDRETVSCDGGACPARPEDCAGRAITYHGHEVVAEVRQFLSFPTHFFAECQAVNAYENTVPNPAWPYLDDAERLGHFLTTIGTPPDCPCADPDFSCVAGGCDDGARDCCLPRDVRERGAGFLIATQPAGDSLRVLSPHVPYNQLDGAFDTVGGSEPAYNLSDTLGTTYTADAEVTMLTGPMGPGDQDLWLTGYLDGVCDITAEEFVDPAMCQLGKVSYLGGHRYATSVPVSANPDTQGTRLFLNALFEADCVTDAAQAEVAVAWSGRSAVTPSDETYTVRVVNGGRGAALDAQLTVTVPAGVEIVEASTGATLAGATATWSLGSLGAAGSAAPPSAVSPTVTLRFSAEGEYTLEAAVSYRVGVSPRTASASYAVSVGPDRDGDGIPDGSDPFPDDPRRCGDTDRDTCDDCAVAGRSEPRNDGPDDDGDGVCDAGETADGGARSGDAGSSGSSTGGCGCRARGGADAPGAWLPLIALALAARRWRS
jgi:MYXO-CTERM domain-containing protein